MLRGRAHTVNQWCTSEWLCLWLFSVRQLVIVFCSLVSACVACICPCLYLCLCVQHVSPTQSKCNKDIDLLGLRKDRCPSVVPILINFPFSFLLSSLHPHTSPCQSSIHYSLNFPDEHICSLGYFTSHLLFQMNCIVIQLRFDPDI